MGLKEAKKVACKSCSMEFECGGNCWCFKYPTILPMDFDTSCFCPECMTLLVMDYIEAYTKELTPEKLQKIQKMGKPKEMIRGIDYTLTSNGYKCMTKWYLLRQGGCCDNGCLNCPY
jgi:hypothetical protein